MPIAHKKPISIAFLLATAALLTIALALEGCKKEPKGTYDPEVEKDQFVPQMIKDIALFKPGSYWIYSDSATGRFDTVTCVNGMLSIQRNNPPLGDHEHLDSDFRSSLGYAWFLNSKGGIGTHESIQRNVSWGGSSAIFYWPYEAGRDIGNNLGLADSAILQPIMDSITLPYGTVGPVYSVYLGFNGLTPSMSAEIWLVPHVGIVRQHLFTAPPSSPDWISTKFGGDWKLVKANIIQ